MNMVLSKLYHLSPKKILQNVGKRLGFSEPHPIDNRRPSDISDELKKMFHIYQTSNLKGITPEEFAKDIQSKIGMIDGESEGYSEDEIEQQRDLSVKFHWGHNHDFGDFKLEGRM